MTKIVYRQMPPPLPPPPRELSKQIPNPRSKARMQKPQGGGKFLMQIFRGACKRLMVMDKTDTCIRNTYMFSLICIAESKHNLQWLWHLGYEISVKYSINNTKLGIIITTSLPLNCGVEKRHPFSKGGKE